METTQRKIENAETSATKGADSGRGGCLPFVALVAALLFLLHDFVRMPVAIPLAVVGAALLYGGVYLSVAGARYVFESAWYAGAWLLGLLMLVAAAATLAPAAPGELLTGTSLGWKVLEARAERVEQAIEDGDIELAGKIARRGIGDPAARDVFGNPLLHLATAPEMVETLLEAGLDPDAEDAEGRTFLMKTADSEIRQHLLDAGADAATGPRRDFSGSILDARDDWLLAVGTASTDGGASGVSLAPSPLYPGDVGTVTIVIDNDGGRDRLLDLQAELGNGVYFVDASHGGAAGDLRYPKLTSTVRWPALALPAGRRGELEMRILAQPDGVVADLYAGDLAIDVRVVDLPQRTEEVLQVYQERADPPDGGGLRHSWPSVLSVVPLILLLALWIAGRRAGKSHSDERHFRLGRIVAGASALVTLAIATVLAWSMIEPYVRFDPASCRVLDRRVVLAELESGRSSSSRTIWGSQSLLQAHPVAAVAIDAGDDVLVAAGFSTGIGARSVEAFRLLPIDGDVTCWLDPRIPTRLSLVRQPSLGGIASLVVLLLLTLVLSLIAIRLGRGARIEAS